MRVGTVALVEDDAAYMDLNDDLVARLESIVGFGPTEQGLYPLQDEMIDRIKEDKVRLRGDHVAQ
ncbi:hypothetical protein D3261_03425 [Halococcus sp. IIIV-5B]|nr:hypothetical protein D3261_03425 [Halococcus sp. IIIV-5B]